jgi:hypothetical protein
MNIYTIQRCDVNTIVVEAENEEEAIEIAAAQSWGWDFEAGRLEVAAVTTEGDE